MYMLPSLCPPHVLCENKDVMNHVEHVRGQVGLAKAGGVFPRCPWIKLRDLYRGESRHVGEGKEKGLVQLAELIRSRKMVCISAQLYHLGKQEA